MVAKYKAGITYDTDNQHPDAKNAKGLVFFDHYTMDTDYHDDESAQAFIRHDLALVAGGGYDVDHIKNVKFKIERIQ